MESKSLTDWLFSAEHSVTMSNPDGTSDLPAQSTPNSTNAPPDPDRPPAEELERLNLDGSHSFQAPEDVRGSADDEEDVKTEERTDVEDEEEEDEEEEAVRVKGGEEEEEEEELRIENGSRNEAEKEGDDTREASRGGAKKFVRYPVRPEAEDCAYYIKTNTCKFGSNCKFNHPIRRRLQGSKERMNDKEDVWDKQGQIECKYYLSPGGCKFGKACKFNHSRSNLVSPAVDLNFLGLPLRPGEKECPYYMRTGTCKYSASCKFNHPDPTSGGDNPPVEYGGGVTPSLPSPSQLHVWSSQGTLNDHPPFVPMVYSPPQVVSSPSSEWNGYQFPMNSGPGHSMTPAPPPPPSYLMRPTTENHMYTNHQSRVVVDEYPERPGQPECSYFLRNGDCKFKSNCKYHHPKERISKSSSVAFSDNGLPLRPDQNICSHYSRYGICKFGPACKFDHSVHIVPSAASGIMDQQSSLGVDGASSMVVVSGSNSVAPEEQQPL